MTWTWIRRWLVVSTLAVVVAGQVVPPAIDAVSPLPVPPDSKGERGARMAKPLLFGVYPGGGTPEVEHYSEPELSAVLERLTALRGGHGPAQIPLNLHLYTSWLEYDEWWITDQLDRFHAAGFVVTLTVKYRPPPGFNGDVAGYEGFVRHIIRTHARQPGLYRVVIGNEGNVYENPAASDGPYHNVRDAIVRGTIAAREELDALGSRVRVGVNFAIVERENDAAYLQDLVQRGGPAFTRAVAFVGINVYPGIWPPTLDDPYWDMVRYLDNARSAVSFAGLAPEIPLEILENGCPTPDEHDQAQRLEAYVSAVVDHAAVFGVDSYSWFSLWDADSHSGNPFAHYGLLRSDLSPKLAFARYQRHILATARR